MERAADKESKECAAGGRIRHWSIGPEEDSEILFGKPTVTKCNKNITLSNAIIVSWKEVLSR